MPKPDFLKMPFEEALEYFRRKRVVSPDEWVTLSDEEKDYAFTIAGIHREDFLEDAKKLLTRMLDEEGMSFEKFKAEFAEFMRKRGWGELPDKELERKTKIIAYTNVTQAAKRGQVEQVKNSGILGKYKYGVWKHGDSPNFRPHHKKLHNKALPLDCELFKKHWPPACFGCRCRVFFAKDEDQVKRMGAEILQGKLPDPKDYVEPGWENSGLNMASLKEESDAIAERRRQARR